MIESLLYYLRAIDGTILPILNTICIEQASATRNTESKCKRLLDYADTCPIAFIYCHISDMVLHIESEAAYLVMPKAHIRIAGYCHISNHLQYTNTPTLNGPLLIECRTIRSVVASSAESKIEGLFHNAQISIPICIMLEALDHPQPPTTINTYNATHGFIYVSLVLKV